jgi:type II secretory pathway pseudopilin PulG
VPFSKASHASRITHHASRITSDAFTLVEILITVTLLAIMTVGLFAVFGQVQRAFRSSMAQSDRLEAGRAVTELLPREFEQIIPSGAPYPNGVNFYARILNGTPLTQSLPGTLIQRTNLLQDCFILQRQNQTWVGIGYCVRNSDANGRLYLPETGSGSGQMGVGSLYRYSATLNVLRNDGLPADPSQLFSNFVMYAAQPGSTLISNRICDGVVHFYLGTYATNGFPIYSDGSHTNAYFRTDPLSLSPPRYSTVHPAQVVANSAYPGNLAALYFYSNAVPASVELQLGILEQPSFERYNSIGAAPARLAYLQREEISGRVHLFRQRIPIRNVDPSAYQ